MGWYEIEEFGQISGRYGLKRDIEQRQPIQSVFCHG